MDVLDNIISENIKRILLRESQESTSQHEAIKLVMDRLKFSKEDADYFVRVTLRNDITSLRDKKIGKFTLGVTRMYIDNQIRDANVISELNSTLKLLSAHLNEYDRNLNGLSAQELISRFSEIRSGNINKEKEEINQLNLANSDYQIVKINSYEEAQAYYEYTNPNSRWCLTHMENMYDSYTCEGINQIYFCLKNGFENIKPVVGENAPLDEYGLSMISVIVNPKGELAYCTLRWNHDNGGNDSAMTAKEISQVVGVNFYETFKPNNIWNEKLEYLLQFLKSGNNIEDVDKNIVSKVYKLPNNEGHIIVMGSKYNVVTTDNRLVSEDWYDNINKQGFKNGYISVYDRTKGYNYIDYNGRLLLDRFYYVCNPFNMGYGLVTDKSYFQNIIDTNGNFLFKDWVRYARISENGYINIVTINEEYQLYKPNFERVIVKGVDENDIISIEPINNHNIADICIEDEGWNAIDGDGNLILPKFFNEIETFDGINIIIATEYKSKYIYNLKGELINDVGFQYVFINDELNLMVGQKYIDNQSKEIILDKNGKIIINEWFNNVYLNKCGIHRVYIRGRGYNFINNNGEYMSDIWFNEATEMRKSGLGKNRPIYSKVVIDEKFYYFEQGKNGEFTLNRISTKNKKIRENYMRKNVIKLTENQFYKVIKESVNKVLNEITSTVHEDDFSVEMDKLYDLLKKEVGGDELSQRLFMLMGDVIFDKNDEDNYIIVYKYSKVGMINILYDLVNYDIICLTPTEIDIANSNNTEIANIISKYVEPDMISRVYDEFQ